MPSNKSSPFLTTKKSYFHHYFQNKLLFLLLFLLFVLFFLKVTDVIQVLVVKTDEKEGRGFLEMISVPDKLSFYKFTFTYQTFKNVILTSDQKHIIIAALLKRPEHDGASADCHESLLIHSVSDGKLVSSSHPKYPGLKPWKKVIISKF